MHAAVLDWRKHGEVRRRNCLLLRRDFAVVALEHLRHTGMVHEPYTIAG